jgi:hypothetical protein
MPLQEARPTDRVAVLGGSRDHGQLAIAQIRQALLGPLPEGLALLGRVDLGEELRSC